jgi:CCR4-NOT transcriptional regulation complex NOT5 subunit
LPLQADKLDPKEQAKMESREWINDMVDRLNVRIEQFEYEMEELQAGLKKKAKPPPKLVQVRRRKFLRPHC